MFTPSVACPRCSYANDEFFFSFAVLSTVWKDVPEHGTGEPSKKF